MRGLTVAAFALLIGASAALSARQVHDIRKSYASVERAFVFVCDLDRRRVQPISLLLDMAKEHGHVDFGRRLELYLAVRDIDPIPNLSLQSAPVDFEIYARHQLRVSEKLSHVTQVAYGDPEIAALTMLPAVQSRIEGTESAALAAQSSYNAAVISYEMLLREWPNAWLAAVLAMPGPHDLPRFTAYGESGPANQESQLKKGGRMPSGDDDDD